MELHPSVLAIVLEHSSIMQMHHRLIVLLNLNAGDY